MKKILYILCLITSSLFAQEQEEELQDIQHIYNGNQELKANDFVDAEAEYRKAISENPTNPSAKYNLGNAYYKHEKTEEALARYNQATKVAQTKEEKHQAFHNMGNSFMQQKKYDAAVEAYKNALRNNPKDDETRYNLALAKKKKEEEERNNDNNKDQNKDKKDQQKDNKDKKDDKKDSDKNKDKDEEGKDKKDKDKKDDKKKDEDKNEGDDEGKDKKDPKDKKDQNKNKGDKPEEKKQQPKQGQLSPQQVQSLLEAMNNQEKKLQEKMNAKKAKGVPVKNEKDW